MQVLGMLLDHLDQPRLLRALELVLHLPKGFITDESI
jgi:hypothetical protein